MNAYDNTLPQKTECATFGPYRAVRKAGAGAHGEVGIAEGAGRLVALKISPRPDDPARETDWEREKRGWSLFSRIPPHPGLVRVFRYGETDGQAAFWVAMQLADSEEGGSPARPETYRPLTLASVAETEVALPLTRVLAIGETLAAGLEHLQKHHLLHRDVKPGNVLFVGGKPVIADAGLVVDVREAASLVGTPGYVPPENHGTPQGDVFSLGRTLWRIGTGRAPEEAGFAPCAEAETDSPDFWRFLAIVGKATNPVPARRYRSAKAMHRDLSRLRAEHAIRANRRLRRLLLVALLPILLPAAFHFSLFRILLMQPDWVKASARWPFPYGILKPLLVSSAPEPPPWKQAEEDIRKQVERTHQEIEKLRSR